MTTLNKSKAKRIWTVVTLTDDRISCSIHLSEYQAYREVVARFEYAELDEKSHVTTLAAILATASIKGDYQLVRQYIQDNARRLCLLQIAEHEISDFAERQAEAA